MICVSVWMQMLCPWRAENPSCSLSSCALSALGAEAQTVLWKSSEYLSPRSHGSSAEEEFSVFDGGEELVHRKEKSQEVGQGSAADHCSCLPLQPWCPQCELKTVWPGQCPPVPGNSSPSCSARDFRSVPMGGRQRWRSPRSCSTSQSFPDGQDPLET